MKIGRNDPCHCGSGQKYKKCCAAKDEAARLNAAETTTQTGGDGATASVQNASHPRGAPPTVGKPTNVKRPPPRQTPIRKRAV